MDRELQKYYESLLSMFQMDGWKYMMEDYGESMKSLQENSDYDCKTNDEWQQRRGELRQLRNILGFEKFIKAGYEGLTDDSL